MKPKTLKPNETFAYARLIAAHWSDNQRNPTERECTNMVLAAKMITRLESFAA